MANKYSFKNRKNVATKRINLVFNSSERKFTYLVPEDGLKISQGGLEGLKS